MNFEIVKSETNQWINFDFIQKNELINLEENQKIIAKFIIDLDIYELQYFTEVLRDEKKEPLFIIKNEEELQNVLKTDAHFFGLWCFDKKNNFQYDLFFRLFDKIPKKINIYFFCTDENLKKMTSLKIKKNLTPIEIIF